MRYPPLKHEWLAAAAFSAVLTAASAATAASARAPAAPPFGPRSVDCTGSAPMAQLAKFNGKVLTFPDVVVPGVTITIVGIKVFTDSTDAPDPCAKLEPRSSYHVRLRAAAQNHSGSQLIVFNASLRCGLFGQDPDAGNVPGAKLATLAFKFAFNDVHDSEYGVSLPFTGSPFDPTDGVTYSDAGMSYFVSGAYLDKCRVLLNV